MRIDTKLSTALTTTGTRGKFRETASGIYDLKRMETAFGTGRSCFTRFLLRTEETNTFWLATGIA